MIRLTTLREKKKLKQKTSNFYLHLTIITSQKENLLKKICFSNNVLPTPKTDKKNVLRTERVRLILQDGKLYYSQFDYLFARIFWRKFLFARAGAAVGAQILL